MLLFLIGALLWALAWLVLDASRTDKGIKAGIAVEGNSVVCTITGTNKPSLAQIMAIELGVIRVPICAIGVIAAMSGNIPLAALMGVILVVAGIKNIQGARKWQWMFDHPGQKLPVMNTVWQQVIGFWG